MKVIYSFFGIFLYCAICCGQLVGKYHPPFYKFKTLLEQYNSGNKSDTLYRALAKAYVKGIGTPWNPAKATQLFQECKCLANDSVLKNYSLQSIRIKSHYEPTLSFYYHNVDFEIHFPSGYSNTGYLQAKLFIGNQYCF